MPGRAPTAREGRGPDAYASRPPSQDAGRGAGRPAACGAPSVLSTHRGERGAGRGRDSRWSPRCAAAGQEPEGVGTELRVVRLSAVKTAQRRPVLPSRAFCGRGEKELRERRKGGRRVRGNVLLGRSAFLLRSVPFRGDG